MSIAANCLSCGAAIKAPDNLAGRKVKCPKCAKVMIMPVAEGEIEAIQETIPAPRASAAPPPAPRKRLARAEEDDEANWSDAADRGRARPGNNNGLAIAGMVLGIVGFLMVFIPCIGWALALVLGVIGATLSGVGMATASKHGGGKGMAIAGLVLSVLAIIWVPIWIFIIVGSTTHALNQAAIQIQQAANNNQPPFAQPPFVVQDKGFPFQQGGVVKGPPTPASGKVTLNNGQATLQGNLAANDPRDRSRPASVCKVFTITMVAGKLYQIDMIQAVGGPDPYLRLEDPDGKNLVEDDDGGDNLNARLEFPCTQAGEYRIVATTFIGGTGNFTLHVSQK